MITVSSPIMHGCRKNSLQNCTFYTIKPHFSSLKYFSPATTQPHAPHKLLLSLQLNHPNHRIPKIFLLLEIAILSKLPELNTDFAINGRIDLILKYDQPKFKQN